MSPKDAHHLGCLGVMVGCWKHVPADLQKAIDEAIESAEELGIPVSVKQFREGKPIGTQDPSNN